MTGVAPLAAAAYLAILAFKAVAARVAINRADARRGPASIAWASEVTVLQPILSGDPHLAAMLGENLARLPHARFAWLIDETDAGARETTASLVASHPDRDVTVARFAEPPPGTNPKTFKLHGALAAARTAYVLVLDDDATLTADAVAVLIDALDGADLATALPCYREASGWPGRLLEQFVNNNAALTYLPLLPFAEPLSINGMCYAFRAEVFRRLDAFGPIRGHLADDLALARRLRQQGLRIAQTIAPVEVRTSVEGWTRYRQQMHRWFLFATLLVHRQSGPMRLAIGTLHGIPPIALLALLGTALLRPSWANGACLVVVLVVRAAVIRGFQKRLTGRVRHRAVLSIVSEVLQPVHLLHAVLVRTIRWRTRTYRVRRDDAFEPE